MKGVTSYKGITKFYFIHLLKKIIKIGRLDKENKKILDFGCGNNELKKMLGERVTGYDIIPELSDIDHWENFDFDVLVSNQVFYCFTKNQLSEFLKKLKDRNKKIYLIVGISRQGIVNNIGKIIFGAADAHSETKIMPSKEIKILLDHCSLIKKDSVLFLADIYYLELNTVTNN
jgi:hypothetical protein